MRLISRSRIKDARLMRGLTLKEAAELAGKSASWLSKIERNQIEVPTAALYSLIMSYGLPLDFFMRPQKERPVRILPQKSKMRLSETTQRRITLRLRSFFELIEILEKTTKEERNEFILPNWQGIEETAYEVRKQLHRDSTVLDNMSKLLEDAGILVKELSTKEIEDIEGTESGFESITIRIEDRYMVGVSAELPAVLQREAMARELGRIIGDTGNVEISESELRSFACHLLLDPSVLEKYYDKSGYLDANLLRIMSYIFGISKRSILEYLVEKQKLQQPGLRYWLSRMKKEGWEEPADYRKCFSDNYYRRLLVKAAIEPEISRDRLAEINSMY